MLTFISVFQNNLLIFDTLEYLIESEDDPIYIYELERLLHGLHKDVKYVPNITFPGSTECFYQIKNIIKTYADVH